MKLKISIISLICLIAVVAGIVAHNARSDALNDEKNALLTPLSPAFLP